MRVSVELPLALTLIGVTLTMVAQTKAGPNAPLVPAMQPRAPMKSPRHGTSMGGVPNATVALSAAESSLKRRWLYLLPAVFVTYSLAYLDRANYGFGAAAGLAATLHITGKDASLLSALFFLGYFMFQVPGAIFARKRGASWLVFSALIAWGVLAALTSLERRTSFRFTRTSRSTAGLRRLARNFTFGSNVAELAPSFTRKRLLGIQNMSPDKESSRCPRSFYLSPRYVAWQGGILSGAV